MVLLDPSVLQDLLVLAGSQGDLDGMGPREKLASQDYQATLGRLVHQGSLDSAPMEQRGRRVMLGTFWSDSRERKGSLDL